MARRKQQKLRERLTDYQKEQRRKKKVKRDRERKILDGVRKDEWRKWS